MIERPCGECIKWVFDNGKPKVLAGRRIPMPVDSPLGCETCPRTAHAETRTRFNAIESDGRSRAAYRHYVRCKAVQRFEDDEAVELMAETMALLQPTIDRATRDREKAQMMAVMVAAIQMAKVR